MPSRRRQSPTWPSIVRDFRSAERVNQGFGGGGIKPGRPEVSKGGGGAGKRDAAAEEDFIGDRLKAAAARKKSPSLCGGYFGDFPLTNR